jgi:hypothetical protein
MTKEQIKEAMQAVLRRMKAKKLEAPNHLPGNRL